VSTPPKHANKRDELRLLINSRHPIITVETPEEERLEALLMDVAMELGVPLYEWSVTTGLAKARGAPLYNSDSPEQAVANIGLIQGDGIFLLKDFARYCDNDKICRRLRDLAEKFRTVRRSIVLTAAKMGLPADLDGDAFPARIAGGGGSVTGSKASPCGVESRAAHSECAGSTGNDAIGAELSGLARRRSAAGAAQERARAGQG